MARQISGMQRPRARRTPAPSLRWTGLAAMAALWSPSPAEACGYLYFGSPDTIIGRTVAITYDRILDNGCGGKFDPAAGIVTIRPRQGKVSFQQGRFSYIARKPVSGTDHFIVTGLYQGKPYKVVVNVTFK